MTKYIEESEQKIMWQVWNQYTSCINTRRMGLSHPLKENYFHSGT